MNYQYVGKIDFIQNYLGYCVVIIRGSDGLSYAANKNDFPKSQRNRIYKGRSVVFNCELNKKIAYEIEIK